jgi:hypothetical protein
VSHSSAAVTAGSAAPCLIFEVELGSKLDIDQLVGDSLDIVTTRSQFRPT